MFHLCPLMLQFRAVRYFGPTKRVHMAPLDLAEELPEMTFGPARVARLSVGSLRDVVGARKYQGLTEGALCLATLRNLRTSCVRTTSSMLTPTARRCDRISISYGASQPIGAPIYQARYFVGHSQYQSGDQEEERNGAVGLRSRGCDT